jgi:hypothetical protein
LEKLGFPWILSSEMSLFNGLRGIFGEKIFVRPFPPRQREKMPAVLSMPAVLAMWKCGIVHGRKLKRISAFTQQNVAETVFSQSRGARTAAVLSQDSGAPPGAPSPQKRIAPGLDRL